MNLNSDDREWILKHYDLFNNINYVEAFLLNIRNVKHSLTKLTDDYIESNIDCSDIYRNPFYNEIRDINNHIGKWEKAIADMHNNMTHTYKIKNMDVLQTGGYVYVYVGQLDNNYWFAHSDDEIRIFDDMPFDPNDEDRDDYLWEESHLVTKLKPINENKYLYQQMDSLLDEIVTNEILNNQFHKHFEDLIKEIESNNYEK